MGSRDLGLERQWRKRVLKHEKSGLTVREFCEREDLTHHQLAWWKSELKRRDAKGTVGKKKSTRTKRRSPRCKTAVADFVPVDIAPSGTSNSAIQVVLDQPVRIAVSSGFDPQVLADVMRTLEGRTC